MLPPSSSFCFPSSSGFAPASALSPKASPLRHCKEGSRGGSLGLLLLLHQLQVKFFQ
jgi:hypothetical protein